MTASRHRSWLAPLASSVVLVFLLAVSGPASAITVTAINSHASTTNAAIYMSEAYNPAANALLLLCVTNTKGSTPDLPTVTGHNLTYHVVATSLYATLASPNNRLTLFRAMGASPTHTVATFDFGGNTQTGIAWSILQFTVVDTSGTNGSGAVPQDGSASANAATSLSVALSAFGSVDNSTYACWGRAATTDTTPESPFVEYDDATYATPGTSVESMYLAGQDTTPSATWPGAAGAGGIAVEIKAATTTTTPQRTLMGVGT